MNPVTTMVTTPAQLKAHINAIIQTCLQEIAKETEEYLKIYVETLWYGDHFPDRYQRTFQFLNSITKSEIEMKGNKMNVAIYFDTSKITPNFLGNGEWNQHMGFNGQPFVDGLIETIENGNPSPYSPSYARGGIGMLKETSKWLEKELPRIAKRVFEKYGLHIIYVV